MNERRKRSLRSSSRASQLLELSKREDEEVWKSNLTKNHTKSQPRQDILADNRRRYNLQDEFVYLLYNEITKILLTKWRKTDHLPKSENPRDFQHKASAENNKVTDNEKSDSNETSVAKGSKDLRSVLSDWKLILSDELVAVEFPNNNYYEGRVSRKQMEGEGIYRWESGETYEGELAENSIHGKGRFQWKDHSWYEGEFHKGYRHGNGKLVSHEYKRFYIGQWYMSRKHGKGYCRYNDKNDDFYEGNWNMDQRHGTGYRIYANGTRYIGQWEDGQRHGIGTMTWPNGDVYRGEWENGTMNGCGEYVWNGFLNESLSWPHENSYMGEWLNGMRHGKGVLKLNSSGGARYSGNWYMDKKHGYGMIIGNSGGITEADPLFLNNVLTPLKPDVPDLTKSDSQTLNEELINQYKDICFSAASKSPPKHKESRKTTVFQPVQFPCLSFHVQRLLVPLKYSLQSFADNIPSGKCRMCDNDSACACLYDHSENRESKSTVISDTILSWPEIESSSSNSPNNKFSTQSEKSNIAGIIIERTEKEFEEHWVHNCLVAHMNELRKIHKLYAELFCSGESIPRHSSMGKIALWQLMRDCGIHKRGISLVQFERYIAQNKSTFIEAEFYPFERIEFFQFIQALLEISWHLYTKLGDIETESMRGRIAGGLYRLLVRDIFPNAGKRIGNVSTRTYRDLLPIFSVYQFYRDVGEPHTARKFIRSTCILKGSSDPKPLPWPKSSATISTPSYFMNGKNAITVGEKLSYIPSEKPLIESCSTESKRMYEDYLARELFALRHLGVPKMVSIISTICPAIKDPKTNTIINMDYELTFLEFYEILLEATRVSIYTKKLSAEEETRKVAAESLARSQRTESTQSKSLSTKTPKLKKKLKNN